MSNLANNTVTMEEILALVQSLPEGGGGEIVSEPPKAVNFRDYDGTILYSYTAAEAAALTAMPALPTRPGLTCQGWNWSLSGMVSYVAKYGECEIGAMYITDDGKTRIYVTLQEERMSPVLGCCPNGTVTVDWGDGTEPDVLTGTSTGVTQWTPSHAYAQPGSYVITLSVNGSVGFYGSSGLTEGPELLRHTSAADERNAAYWNSISKIELGANIEAINAYAFSGCANLKTISIPSGVAGIRDYAFYNCTSLKFIVFPTSATTVGISAFAYCGALTSVALCEGVTKISGTAFMFCLALTNIIVPSGVSEIGTNAFQECLALLSIVIPSGFRYFNSNMLNNCYSIKRINMSGFTSIPRLTTAGIFNGLPSDCEIWIPASLYDRWSATTNWSAYADYYVGV